MSRPIERAREVVAMCWVEHVLDPQVAVEALRGLLAEVERRIDPDRLEALTIDPHHRQARGWAA